MNKFSHIRTSKIFQGNAATGNALIPGMIWCSQRNIIVPMWSLFEEAMSHCKARREKKSDVSEVAYVEKTT